MGVALEQRETGAATPDMGADVCFRAREYCEREGVLRELRIALELVGRHFPSVRPVVDLVRDPDSDEEWVSTHVVFAGKPDDFRRRYRALKREWLAATSWPASHKVRFSYGIV